MTINSCLVKLTISSMIHHLLRKVTSQSCISLVRRWTISSSMKKLNNFFRKPRRSSTNGSCSIEAWSTKNVRCFTASVRNSAISSGDVKPCRCSMQVRSYSICTTTMRHSSRLAVVSSTQRSYSHSRMAGCLKMMTHLMTRSIIMSSLLTR